MKFCDTCHSTYPTDFTSCPKDQTTLRLATELMQGMIIRDKYEIVGKIGAGGMATVYRARHLVFNEPRAIKLVISRGIALPSAETTLQRRLMTMLRMIAVILLFVALAAMAQEQPSNQQGGHQGKPPRSATHNGHPALEYEGMQGWGAYIEYLVRQGEPALGFTMAQMTSGSAMAQLNCPGHVYVTRTRISGEFQGTACESFDAARNGATAEKQEGKVTLTAGGTTYTLVPIVERGDERRSAPRMGAAAEFLVRSVKNFNGTYANVRRLGAEAQLQSAGQTMQPTAATGATAQTRRDLRGILSITSDPGDVQVYVNDEPRGMTSAEGREVLRMPPGTYRLRLSLPGYKDFEQQVTLVSAKEQDVTAKMETVGPPPFQASDVTEMLQGKMSPKRIASLTQERGVDFELNPDLEKRLRGLGATSDLLLAIATNKKK